MYMGPSDASPIFRVSNFHLKAEAPESYRTVLHCDANSFFVSCEIARRPEYAGKPVAVCGSEADRHGIVLAKNDIAKGYRVKTAETVWQARQKCPELVIVPPNYSLYAEMSEKMNDIFYEYTDRIEPFGVDESWLDVSCSAKLFGNGREIANRIRERIANELGITVSIGVSFNKVFAKLGSDLKKPNAISVIPPESFASIVWPLPVTALLFVGRSTAFALEELGVWTIGDLACCDDVSLEESLGKNGLMLKRFALGRDYAEVTPWKYSSEPKSVSNGMTFRYNLSTPEEVSFAVTYLSMSVAERLRKHSLCCKNVSVSVRTPDMKSFSRTVKLPHPSCLYSEISQAALALIKENTDPESEIYSVTVSAEKLTALNEFLFQQQIFGSAWESKYKKRHLLETTVDSIRSRYGRELIGIASQINNRLI